MTYRFIDAQRACYPVSTLCWTLHVSARGSDAWRQRRPSAQRQVAAQQFRQQVDRVFRQSRQTDGSPRVDAVLRAEGIVCSRRREARVMRMARLVACWHRTKRHICTTESDHARPVALNRLNRDFSATAPDQKWVGDSTAKGTPQAGCI